MKKIVFGIVLTLLVLATVCLLIKLDLHQDKTTDGIDISHHNLVRDWNKVNAAQDSTV